MKLILAALALLAYLVAAYLLRDPATDMRLMQLDADDSEAVGEFVPMSAWLPEADRYQWDTTIRAKGGI